MASTGELDGAQRGLWQQARFYREDHGRIVCTLCPHRCRLDDGQTGRCSVRRRTGNRLETAGYATTVFHTDKVERKPLYHFRPGLDVVTLAPGGCTFSCGYCQNHRLSQGNGGAALAVQTRVVVAADVVAAAASAGAAVGLSYTEPTLAAELTIDLAIEGRRKGVDVIWKTNGFVTDEARDELAGCLAAVNIDLKAADDARHRALTGAPLAPVLETLAAFVRAGVWVEVSTPLIPGINTDANSLGRLAEIIGNVGRDIPWHLGRYNPDFRMADLRPTAAHEIAAALEAAGSAGLRYVYVERALGDKGRSTRCPGCGETVVARDVWAAREVRLEGGKCPKCNFCVAGRWYGGLA